MSFVTSYDFAVQKKNTTFASAFLKSMDWQNGFVIRQKS